MKKVLCMAVAGLLVLAVQGKAYAGADLGSRLEVLEKQVSALTGELAAARAELDRVAREDAAVDASPAEDAGQPAAGVPGAVASAGERLSLGGYGEMHANFVEGGSGDVFDIHRLVLYLGYDFSDWIKLGSEIESEHAYVSTGSGGELNIEQLYVDFLLHDALNVRVGRMLAPMGITNQRHEPPSFNGVERPSFDKVIIPTTWSVDGIGTYGNLTHNLRYQVDVGAGLDGTKFSAKDGIRGGRIKERPSFNNVAVMGRADYFPLMDADVSVAQDLRLGGSFYHGGINNGNNGKDPGIDGSVTIFSADMEATLKDVDVRGAAAYTVIDGAEKLPGVAEGIFGYYVEAGYHFWPESLKTGKLGRSDAVVFARYDDYDTQFRMPSGISGDPAGDRQEYTFGVNFYPVPNLVLKADYQIRDSRGPAGLDNLINFGVGFQL
ncbi:MAG: hypothetical protein HZC51_07260 [Nitrospirae bacterium]|nr:hypothetical protein [Nitrospirota bacterium]